MPATDPTHRRRYANFVPFRDRPRSDISSILYIFPPGLSRFACTGSMKCGLQWSVWFMGLRSSRPLVEIVPGLGRSWLAGLERRAGSPHWRAELERRNGSGALNEHYAEQLRHAVSCSLFPLLLRNGYDRGTSCRRRPAPAVTPGGCTRRLALASRRPGRSSPARRTTPSGSASRPPLEVSGCELDGLGTRSVVSSPLPRSR
jgi:hypothetical protein